VGRSFESVRIAFKDVSAHRAKAALAMKKEDRVYALRLAEMAKKHSSEAFYALDDIRWRRRCSRCWWSWGRSWLRLRIRIKKRDKRWLTGILSSSEIPLNPKHVELEAAEEILAEVLFTNIESLLSYEE